MVNIVSAGIEQWKMGNHSASDTVGEFKSGDLSFSKN
jgi:hypothetical protein